MAVEYNHKSNCHSLEGPQLAIRYLFAECQPKSLLDVGCGVGTWIRAAIDIGISDVFGLDGVRIPTELLLFPATFFQQQDLTSKWTLGRTFDVVLCLEVAEHMDCSSAPTLVDSLVAHGNTILFSAACPGQKGQNHVNCQWPIYWQDLFNERGFACSDGLRWTIWNESQIEPWYRQNLFLAERDPKHAGTEPRIPSVIHPEILPYLESSPDFYRQIRNGSKPLPWYVQTFTSALHRKLTRSLARCHDRLFGNIQIR